MCMVNFWNNNGYFMLIIVKNTIKIALYYIPDCRCGPMVPQTIMSSWYDKNSGDDWPTFLLEKYA